MVARGTLSITTTEIYFEVDEEDPAFKTTDAKVRMNFFPLSLFGAWERKYFSGHDDDLLLILHTVSYVYIYSMYFFLLKCSFQLMFILNRSWPTQRVCTANGCSVRSEPCFLDATFCRIRDLRSSWPTEVNLQISFKLSYLLYALAAKNQMCKNPGGRLNKATKRCR